MEVASNAKYWCEREFGGADLGAERLNRRFISVAASLLGKPEASLSQAIERPSAERAMGRFFDMRALTTKKSCHLITSGLLLAWRRVTSYWYLKIRPISITAQRK